MEPSIPRKRKAPPVDPNNSEATRLARAAERKKQRLTEAAPQKGMPAVAAVRKSRAASVEDVNDVDNLQSAHRQKPKNPDTIIESSMDGDEGDIHVMAQKKGRRTETTSKSGQSGMPITATVDRPFRNRAASVEDVEDIDSIQSTHRAKPKNPNTIIESSEDEDEPEVLATDRKKKGRTALNRRKPVNKSRAASVEDVEDIEIIQSSQRAKPKHPNTIIESSEDEDELDQSGAEQPTESAEAELSK
jgi:hypothetical protein